MKTFDKTTRWSIIALLAIFLAIPQVFAQALEQRGKEPGIGQRPESGIYHGREITDKPYVSEEADEARVEYEGASVHRASQLMGRRVVSASGETVGTLHDLVLFEGGQVHYAIILVDNKSEKQYVPVPYNSIRSIGQGLESDEGLTVNLDQNTLANAPGFSENELDNLWNTDIGEEVHGYYGFRPFAAEPGVGIGPESGIYKGRTITNKPYVPMK